MSTRSRRINALNDKALRDSYGRNRRSKLRSVCSPTAAARGAAHARPAARPPSRHRTARCACRDTESAPGTGCRSRPAAGPPARRRRPVEGSQPSGRSRHPESTGRSRCASARSAAAGSPVKQWKTPRSRPCPSSCDDAKRVVLGLARVNHDRQIALEREPDLHAKHLVLHLARREVVVIIEADLADGARRRQRVKPLVPRCRRLLVDSTRTTLA